MTTELESTFEIKSWDEKPYDEREGAAKLARASISTVYHGALEGEGALEYLLVYVTDTAGSYVGVERVTGRIGDRAGSFILQYHGTFGADGGAAQAECRVIAGSGTGELRGLRGNGGYVARHGEHAWPFRLAYDFE